LSENSKLEIRRKFEFDVRRALIVPAELRDCLDRHLQLLSRFSSFEPQFGIMASFATLRYRMTVDQLERRGIVNPRVLQAMANVPRELFVLPREVQDAYADRALSLDCGQTISQPYIVGLMTEALELTGGEHVLEIGTGSGYQTAVLCELARWVTSVERHAELSAHAATKLKSLSCANCELIVADGTSGWPANAPYDRIIVTAGAARVPHALAGQLTEGGILIIPIGPANAQSLHAIRKRNGELESRELSACRFVPLVGVEQPS
jgi:protein-L-isoaspartate(D-aspartate) O-methyltransferase